MSNPHLEIERKFLIEKLPRLLERHPHKEIAQGYLVVARDRSHVRLRRAGRACTLTFKRGPARAREEREIHLTPAQFVTLWPATAGSRLTKIRYYIPFKKLTIEIDIYRGSNAGPAAGLARRRGDRCQPLQQRASVPGLREQLARDYPNVETRTIPDAAHIITLTHAASCAKDMQLKRV